MKNFVQRHPQLADFIAEQKNRYGIFSTAAAIESVKDQTLSPEARRRGIAVRSRLTSIYNEDSTGDPNVLWSHGTAIDAMHEMPNAADDYLSQLEIARHDRAYWTLVRDDSVALSSQLLRQSEDLREHYRKNRDWYLEMMEVLVERLEIEVADDSRESSYYSLDELVRVASAGNPYLIELVPAPKKSPIEACIYFETFRQFGEAIVLASAQGVSPKEAVQVIILNRDALAIDNEFEIGTVDEPTSLAARLIQLNRTRPDVWKAAQHDGLVLAFDQLTPGLAQSVLAKHPDLGAASLIVTQYRDLATQAASIVDHYGELGIAVLVQYEGSEKFRELLRSANVDHRVAMVAAIKSDVGLEAVLKDPAYIDKWIGDDGQPLEEEWWTNVPLVGGVGKVAKNWATGVPSDWSEIGWAAWDVAF